MTGSLDQYTVLRITQQAACREGLGGAGRFHPLTAHIFEMPHVFKAVTHLGEPMARIKPPSSMIPGERVQPEAA